MEEALGTASAQGTASVLPPPGPVQAWLWAAPPPHDACSDRGYFGFGGPFPGAYGSGYSGLHASRQPGAAGNGFNLLPAPQALGAEASFGTQMPPGLQAPSGSVAPLGEATWGSSLPYSAAFVGDFSPLPLPRRRQCPWEVPRRLQPLG